MKVLLAPQVRLMEEDQEVCDVSSILKKKLFTFDKLHE